MKLLREDDKFEWNMELQIVFLALKLSGQVEWTWPAVLIPFWLFLVRVPIHGIIVLWKLSHEAKP